jgi:hypothetical protein
MMWYIMIGTSTGDVIGGPGFCEAVADGEVLPVGAFAIKMTPGVAALGFVASSLPLPPIAPVRTSAKAIAPASTPAPTKILRLMFAPQFPVSGSPRVKRQRAA